MLPASSSVTESSFVDNHELAIEFIEKLLEEHTNCSPTYPRNLNQCYEETFYLLPLHYAIIQGRQDLITQLLEHGAKTNLPDSYGRTPLMWAAMYAEHHIINLLIVDYKVDISAVDKAGLSALHHAAHTLSFIKTRQRCETIGLLISYGILKQISHSTPLFPFLERSRVSQEIIDFIKNPELLIPKKPSKSSSFKNLKNLLPKQPFGGHKRSKSGAFTDVEPSS
ncbi:ankyrin repeat domain-containing protein [Candidatus Babeliales bacterium]|nr:ankyrin repeat domain-containing protein [Candidatus Babeliales bacterium]